MARFLPATFIHAYEVINIMKSKFLHITLSNFLFAAFISTSISTANAGMITYGNTSVSTPNNIEDFERPGSHPYGELLTSQFSSNGISFVGNTGYAPVLFNNGGCQPSPNNFSGTSYVAFGVSTGCGVPGDYTSASILFDDLVEELSFDFTTNNSSDYTFEALLNGNVVSNLVFSNTSGSFNTTFLYSGSIFDELRFVETGTSDWFWMDDLSWKTTQVPEPSAIALFGLGLLGLGFARKKKM